MRSQIAALGSFAVFLLLGQNVAHAGDGRLLPAIANCQVDTVKRLLQAGADPNLKDARGPVLRWLASGSKCTDASALATAKLLDEHGARFQDLAGASNPSLLVNLAPRHLPDTLAFLAGKPGSGDPTQALRAIARSGDLASLRALLATGADPLSGAALSSALFDAAAAGQAESVKEFMLHLKDKRVPKVLAAREVGEKHSAVAQAFHEVGIDPPPAPAPRACQPRELSHAQARLLARLDLPNGKGLAGLAGGTPCKLIQECGDLLLVDCDSAADGPAYYLNQKTSRLLATCGGACMSGCTGCPPEEWTCSCRF